MKAIKRTVAALLATLMLATSTSFTLAAEEYTNDEAVVVAKVNAAGIMTGTDKGFEPSKSLTRAEAAAIIVRMKGISESAVKATAGTTLFNDVSASHWASGYINQASNLGIVKGVSATEFAPDREVLISEFVTMAVRAIGAGQLVDSEGVWPTNYINFANENDLLKDVNSIYTATSTRLQAATIVANSLEAPMWEKVGVKSNGEIEWGKSYFTQNSEKVYKNILADVLKLKEKSIVVAAVSNNDKTVTDNKDKVWDVEDGFNLASVKVGLSYKAYVDEDNDIQGMWIDEEDSETFTVINELNSTSKKVTLTIDGKEKEFKYVVDDSETADVDEEAKVVINEKTAVKIETALASVDDKKDFEEGKVYFDDNGKVTAIYITAYDKYGIVDDVTKTTVQFKSSSDVKEASTNAASSIKFTDDNKEFFLTKDGVGIKYSDLKEGDAVKYYLTTDGKKYVGEVISDKFIVSGKVTATGSEGAGKDYAKIDGVKYKGYVAGLKTNDEITAYVNNANKIVMYTYEEKEADDVAIIKYIKSVPGNSYGADGKVLPEYELKLLFTDGTTSDTLDVDLKATADKFIDENADGKFFYDVDDDDLYVADSASTSEKEAAAREYIKDIMEDNMGTGTLANKWLGAPVGYEINGREVTICPIATDYKGANIDNSALKVGSKTVTVGNFYLNSSTVVINIKADDEHGFKSEVVKVEDLDDITSGVYATVLGYNKDSKEVDTLVISAKTAIARVKETNFAFVTEASTTKYENKAAQEVVVIFVDGTKETYTYCSKEADNESLTFAPGEVYDLTVKDGMIMDAEVPNAADGKDNLVEATAASADYEGYKYLVDTFSGRAVLGNGTDTNSTKDLLLADNVLVLIKDGAKYTVSSIDEIGKVSYNADATTGKFNLADKEDVIGTIWTYTDDTDTNAVVIVYGEDVKLN